MAGPRGLCPTSGMARIADYLKAGLDADDCEVGLFNSFPTLSPTTTLADLVEPTYPGYARVPCAPWTIAVVGPANYKVEQTAGLLFTSSQASPSPTVLRGSFIVNSGGDLLFAQFFNRAPFEPWSGSPRLVFVSLIEGNLYLSVRYDGTLP